MNQHDFIFSNHFRHRVARHATFWFACWIFFMITFYIPFCVFPAWDTEKFAGNIARSGLLKWLWRRLFNSTITFIPLLAFAYTIIYFVLPRHFFNKKNLVTTTALFASVLVLILLAQYFSCWLVAWNLVRVNPTRRMPAPAEIINHISKIVLFNYPVVTGFAVIIKMMKRGWLKQQETHQIAQEKATAELQLLKAQIHPHFLFNTLNNIYFFTLTSPQKAPEMLIKLSDILRYLINECNQPLVPLAKELKMIEDYMALEKIRYGEHLKMELEIKGDHSYKMIPPLLLIPLVENSFKHGTSKVLTHPWVNLNISVEGQYLYLVLSNSRPNELTLPQLNGRIGLANVKKRLQLLYPQAYELNIAEVKHSFEVFMKIKLVEDSTIIIDREVETENNQYAVA